MLYLLLCAPPVPARESAQISQQKKSAQYSVSAAGGVAHLLAASCKSLIQMHNPKYLYYYYDWDDPLRRYEAGLLHLLTDLQTLCREAAWLGRTPVFPSIAPLRKSHNFDIDINEPCSKYLDTEHIDVQYYCEGANAPPLKISLSAIDEAQLREMDIPQHKILKIPAGAPITAAQNRRFDLIARRMSRQGPAVHHRQRGALLTESFAHDLRPAEKLPPGKEPKVLRVTLRPSREVCELAQEVIRRLPPDYCAIHVRRGDALRMFPAFSAWTSPAAVVQALQRAGVADDAPAYLMSDERNRRWLAAIRKQRSILHHTDFPRLAELIQPPGAIDNYFLFAVEREIMQHAAKKILSWPREWTELISKNEFLIRRPVRFSILWNDRRRLYHPAEIRLHRRRMGLSPEPSEPCSYPLLKKMKRLAKELKPLMRCLIDYFARRLFLPGSLHRFRNRRKALDIP